MRTECVIECHRCASSQGDLRGIRGGFEGDSQPFWGIRALRVVVFFAFWGDLNVPTSPFYNIKRGKVGWRGWGGLGKSGRVLEFYFAFSSLLRPLRLKINLNLHP